MFNPKQKKKQDKHSLSFKRTTPVKAWESMCSENSNPLAIFALIAEGTRIHAMSWPGNWALGQPMRKFVSIATLNFAQMAKCFVVSSCGIVDAKTIEKLRLSSTERDFLLNPENSGGSMIVAPNADILAGPMGNKEGIIQTF